MRGLMRDYRREWLMRVIPALVFLLAVGIAVPSTARDDASGTMRTPDEAAPTAQDPVYAASVEKALLPAASIDVTVSDVPNDDGAALDVSWTAQGAETGRILEYRVFREGDGDGKAFERIDSVVPVEGKVLAIRDEGLEPGWFYTYRIAGWDGEMETVLGESSPTRPTAQWLHLERISMLVAVLLLSAFILWYIYHAQKGKELFIRKISGLAALDEAVGRATEMGRAVLYIPGIMDMDDIQTIAGVTILSHVAKKTAEYDTKLMVPVSRSMVMSTAQEVVKESYYSAGRPDAFRPEMVWYLTDEQFGYAAGVDGIMVREQPAAIFYMGTFYAESLILAETGNSVGAIQIAGTAMPSQLPFFVAACDYTLIGEELFAASAYLSRDPHLLGSLKGQDIGKAVFILSIIIGVLFETLNHHLGMTGFSFSQLFHTG